MPCAFTHMMLVVQVVSFVTMDGGDQSPQLLDSSIVGTWFGGPSDYQNIRLEVHDQRTMTMATLGANGGPSGELTRANYLLSSTTIPWHLDINYSSSISGGDIAGWSVQRCLLQLGSTGVNAGPELRIQLPHEFVTVPYGQSTASIEILSSAGATSAGVDASNRVRETHRPTAFDETLPVFYYTFRKFATFADFAAFRSFKTPEPFFSKQQASNSGSQKGVLRFAEGDAILANINGNYRKGKIAKIWDSGKPYRVQLDDVGSEVGTEVWALEDTDAFVKANLAAGTIAAQLRFKVGDSVLANIGGSFKTGVVSRVRDAVAGTINAYRIRLADGTGTEALAAQDTDAFVKAIPLPPSTLSDSVPNQVQLRFKVGDAVLANVGGAYKSGQVVRVGDAGNPYRILLVDGSEVWAPEDADGFVKAA